MKVYRSGVIVSVLLASATAAASSEPVRTYVGAKVCGSCHTDKYELWSKSLHSRMIQDASPASVLGDFKVKNTLVHGRTRYRMFMQNGQYVISEQEAGKAPVLYTIQYTLGSKRVQHYLSRLPDGRIRVTFPSWDSRAKEWFHSTDIVRTSDFAEVPIQIWNKHCYNCHATDKRQNFDLGDNVYQTAWTNHGTACEACHGPGSLHVAKYQDKSFQAGSSQHIVFPRLLEKEKKMQVCTQCHQPRIMISHGYQSGANYYDYYFPTLMHFYIDRVYDPPMWPDGRMRRFATEGLALMQSQCYLKGDATCITCHDPHFNTIGEDKRLAADSDAVCTQCHKQLEPAASLQAHTHHKPDSAGSRCVSCHMPYITGMLKDHERDHSISIPTPETTGRFGVPNACTLCHNDKSPDWAAQSADALWPGRPRANLKRAEAFSLAIARKPAAVEKLIPLLEDRGENTIVRGSAAGFLGEYKGEKVAQVLIKTLADPEVIVRAEAARSLGELRSEAAVPSLAALLTDPNRVVRLQAVFALIKMGITAGGGPSGAAYRRAEAEYVEFLEAFPDLEGNQIGLGTYLAVNGRFEEALKAYQAAARLDAQRIDAHYYIGVTYARTEQWDRALKAFREVLNLDPNFRNTRELMAKVLEIKGQAAPPRQPHP